MKYTQPYGVSDPNAPYVNGDPSIAQKGLNPAGRSGVRSMRSGKSSR